MNVTDGRQQTDDRRTGDAARSRSLTFTFAKKPVQSMYVFLT